MSTEHLAALIEEELRTTSSDPPSAILRVARPLRLTNRQKDLVRALACVMWADGKASPQERRLVEQVIDELGPTADERAEMTKWLESDCSSLGDVQIERLSDDEKQVLLTHAVVLTMADDVQLSSDEKAMLAKLVERVALPEDVVAIIMEDAREDGAVRPPGSAFEDVTPPPPRR